MIQLLPGTVAGHVRSRVDSVMNRRGTVPTVGFATVLP